VTSQGTTISEVYVVAVSGGEARQISHDPGSGSPLWSPDGREIAFVSPDSSGNYNDVTLTKPDGSDQHTPGTGLYGTGLDVSTMNWVLGGRKLFVTSGTGEYLVNNDGSHFRQVLAEPNDYDFFPSPDGKMVAINESGGPLVYPTCCGPGIPRYSRIDILDLASGQLRPLTQK